MATAFNLTAQLNLQGPTNTKAIAAQIKKDLGDVSSNVNININAKSAKAVETVTTKLKAMNDALIRAKGNTDSLKNSLSGLSSALKSVSGVSSNTSKTINNTAKASVVASKGLKEASGAMESLGKQAGITIKRFAAYSIVTTTIYGVVNAINDGYKAMLQFDREMVRLQQVTKSGAIGIKSVSDAITSLSTSLGVSSNELAKVSVTLAQAGLTANQTRTALEALAKSDLAPSFDNITKTAEGSIAALRQFGLQANELESALGSINAVASAFAVESGDIIGAIQRTGGVFASASKGVSEGKDALQEFIAIFTSVRATTRESAETIATGLRTIFTRIQRGSTIDYLEQFNIKLRDNKGNFVGAYEAVKRLSEGLKEIGNRDPRFLRIVEELGGFRQIGKVIPLIQEFGVAQEALGVAQRGQSSLTEAAAKAQQSLVVQLAKVREEFQALVRSVGETTTFKVFLQTTISLTKYLVKLANVFKPILPILAILGTVKAVGAIGKFGAGFAGAVKKGGGAKGVGEGVGRSLTGGGDATDKERSSALSRAASATNSNTEALKSLTSSVDSLANKINAMNNSGGGSRILGPDGKPYKFASGGVVPGSGNRDTVPALLTPGEVVINKKAANKYGRGNLVRMNKYGAGGQAKVGAINDKSVVDGDTIKINITPTDDSFDARTRLSGADAFEKTNRGGRKNSWQKRLGIAATNYAEKYYANKSNKDVLNTISSQQGNERYGRYIIEDNQLASALISQGLGVGRGGNKRASELTKEEYTSMFGYPPEQTIKKYGVKSGGLIQKFAGGGESISMTELIEQGSPQLRGRSNSQDELRQYFEDMKIGQIQAKAAAKKLLGKKDYSDAMQFLMWSHQEDQIAKSVIADAQEDPILQQILSESEGQPIGKKVKALVDELGKTTRNDIYFAVPTVSALGPNITPELLEEGIKKGYIGSSLGIDVPSSIYGEKKKKEHIPKGDYVFFGEKLKKFVKDKDFAKIEAKLEGSKKEKKLRKLDARTEANLGVADRQGEEILAIDLIRLFGEQQRAEKELMGGSEADRLEQLASMIAEGKEDIPELNGDPDLAKRTNKLITKWNSAAKKGDWTKLELEQDAIDSILEDINDPNIFAALSGGKLSRGARKFREDFALALDGKPLNSLQSARDLQQIVKAITTANYASGGLVQAFASGGTVPAMVSNGEAFIPPNIAKKIGYSKLQKMNQADRNGMQGFAGGGISVFKGAGHGTSDSIGPVGLPEGSFILREKATKALGLSKGGPAGFIQRFADGGASFGGLGYPGSMPSSGLASEAKATAEALDALKDKAKEAGMSFKRYQKTIKEQIQKLASTKIEEKVQGRKNISSFLVQNRAEVKKASMGSSEIQNFKNSLTTALRDLDLDLPTEKIERASQEAVNAIKSGFSIEEVIQRVDILNKAFDSSADAAKALEEAHKEMQNAVGPLTDAMKASAEDLEAFKYKESGQAQKDFGIFGKLNPAIALDMLRSKEGSKRQAFAEDALALKNLPLIGRSMGQLNDMISEMDGPIANATRSIGGLAGGVAIATSMIGSELVPAFSKLIGQTENAYLAGVGGALAGAGSQAASFATIGSQLFGPQGALAGLLLGAITGLISGFSNAFQTKKLENSLMELNKTMVDVEKAFTDLDKNRTRENITRAQTQNQALMGSFQDLQSQAAVSFSETLVSRLSSSASWAAAGSAFFGGAALLLGNLGPQVALPDELATVPAAAWFGGKLGAGLGWLYDAATSFMSGGFTEIDNEAFNARLDVATKYVEGLSHLSKTEIDLKSLEDIQEVLNPLRDGFEKIDEAVKAGTMTMEEAANRRKALEIQAGKSSVAIEQAIFGALSTKYDLDPTKDLQSQLKQAGPAAQAEAKIAADQAALAAGLQRIKQLYGENTLQARKLAENTQDVIDSGYELYGQQYKQDLIQKELSETYRESVNQSENLINKLDKVNARLNRFGTELEEITRKAEIDVGVFSGEAKLGGVNRTNEAMLGNMRAYSDAELEPVIASVSRIVGGQAGSQLSEGLQARRILQENLPEILSNVDSQNVGEVETQVRQLFDKAGLSENLGRDFADQVRKSIESGIGGRQGKSFDELIQDFPALQESMKVIEKNFDTSANALKQYNDAIEQIINKTQQWGESLEKSRQYQLKATQSRIDAENKLARARGEYVGPTEENRSFVAEIRSLTGGTGVTANGQILVDQIKDSYDNLVKDIEKQQSAVENSKDATDRAKQLKKLDELNRKANNQYQALEEIANNTSMLDSLIDAMGRNKEKSLAAGRFVEDMFTSSSADLAGRANQINMYNRFRDMDLKTRSGRATYDQLFRNSPENRASVFEGLDYIESFGFDTQVGAQKRRAQAQLQAIEAMRYEGQDTSMFTNKVIAVETFDEKQNRIVDSGERISIEEALRRRQTGEYIDPLEARTKAEMDRQVEANGYLADLAAESAGKRREQIETIIDLLRDLPTQIANQTQPTSSPSQQSESNNSNGPGVYGEDNPRMAALVKELSRIKHEQALVVSKMSQSGKTPEGKQQLEHLIAMEKALKEAKEKERLNIQSTVGLDAFSQELKEIEKVFLEGDRLKAKHRLDDLKKEYDKQFGLPPEAQGSFGLNEDIARKHAETIARDIERRLELAQKNNQQPQTTTTQTPSADKAKLDSFVQQLKEIERLSGGGISDKLSAKSKLEELKRQYDTQFGLPEEAKGDFGMDVNLAKTQAEAIARDIEKRQSQQNQNNQTSAQTPTPIDNTVVTLDNAEPVSVVLANIQDISEMNPALDLINNNGCCDEIVAAVTSLKETMMSSMGNIGTDIGFAVVEAFKTIQVPLRLETQSQNFLDNFNSKFNSYVSRLEQAAAEIPQFITLVGKHTVDVNIRGADVLQTIEPRIKQIVENSVDAELDRYTKENGMPPTRSRGTPAGGGGGG